MIVIVVDSMTGMGLKFAAKLGYPFFPIDAYVYQDGHQVLLITRSVNFGDITEPTRRFLDQFANQTIGMLVSGNRNWGKNYGAAGDKIQLEYKIPLILKFEGMGFPHEVAQVKNWLKEKTSS
jgi:ribonucleoside-diphosphate reductase protein NrdI